MISKTFIERPKFAMVVSIVITLAGLISIALLPVAEFPQITPPQVSVTTAYPGANAQTLVDAVAGPIEQRVNGAEGMIYMQSTSADDGSYTLNVTFDFGIDPDQAQVNVQNLVSQAEPILPEEVKRQGVTVRKQSTDILMVVNVYSPDESLSPEFISNYTSINVADVLARVDGVAEARSLGALDYGMRIWLDPDRMAAIGLTVEDVVAAIREQNVEVAVGQIGGAPIPEGQQFQYTLTAKGRLETVEEFERIVVRAGGGARIVYLKDIARVELGYLLSGSELALGDVDLDGLAGATSIRELVAWSGSTLSELIRGAGAIRPISSIVAFATVDRANGMPARSAAFTRGPRDRVIPPSTMTPFTRICGT